MRVLEQILKRSHLEHIDVSFFVPGAADWCGSGSWFLCVVPQAAGPFKNAFAQQVAVNVAGVDDQ